MVWGRQYGDPGEKWIFKQASQREIKLHRGRRQATRWKGTLYLVGGTRHGAPRGGHFLGADTNYRCLCKLPLAGQWGDTHGRGSCAETMSDRPQVPHPSLPFDIPTSKMLTFLFKYCSITQQTTSPVPSPLFLGYVNNARD